MDDTEEKQEVAVAEEMSELDKKAEAIGDECGTVFAAVCSHFASTGEISTLGAIMLVQKFRSFGAEWVGFNKDPFAAVYKVDGKQYAIVLDKIEEDGVSIGFASVPEQEEDTPA